MDLCTTVRMIGLLFGVGFVVGLANLIDFGFRTMAENKAKRAEAARCAKWGLPARPPTPETIDDHLWHF